MYSRNSKVCRHVYSRLSVNTSPQAPSWGHLTYTQTVDAELHALFDKLPSFLLKKVKDMKLGNTISFIDLVLFTDVFLNRSLMCKENQCFRSNNSVSACRTSLSRFPLMSRHIRDQGGEGEQRAPSLSFSLGLPLCSIQISLSVVAGVTKLTITKWESQAQL